MLAKTQRFSFMTLLLVLILSILVGCGTKKIEDEVLENKENSTGNGEMMNIKTSINKSGNQNPLVTIEMENGKHIYIELYPDIAPNTVYNFISLIQQGYYDGLIFHRVIPGFMIQGGDPLGSGYGGPGYAIKGEFTNNGFENPLSHTRGVISMARTLQYDSAGSQFFIVVEDSLYLDGDYAAFGKVIEGMDVVDEIVNVERDQSNKPYVDQVMKKVTVETFGVNYPEPEVIQKNQ